MGDARRTAFQSLVRVLCLAQTYLAGSCRLACRRAHGVRLLVSRRCLCEPVGLFGGHLGIVVVVC
jgi:hypothetical protein